MRQTQPSILITPPSRHETESMPWPSFIIWLSMSILAFFCSLWSLVFSSRQRKRYRSTLSTMEKIHVASLANLAERADHHARLGNPSPGLTALEELTAVNFRTHALITVQEIGPAEEGTSS